MNIWKYELDIRSGSTIKLSMPAGARPLSVQVQNQAPMLWALVDPKEKKQDVEFILAGTGIEFELPANATFVGTFQMYGGSLVLHLFWVVK